VPLLPGAPEDSANWQFAVYQWKPPATAAPAPAEPRLPPSYSTNSGHGQALRRLITSRSGGLAR
jgi:hypothetical protein